MSGYSHGGEQSRQPLSSSEIELLDLVLEELSAEDIARRLRCGPEVVHQRLRRILERIKDRGSTQA